MPKNDYWKLSANESAKLIRNGSISAEDLVSSCVERTKATNKKIGLLINFGSESLEYKRIIK
jgi:Asp-tRNA(Asn)/Glu-tRNA(Gln) amidotransferase A subunit family amidase